MKQQEVKQEIKKEIKKQTKNWFQKKLEKIEKLLLHPLKIKIQEGSTLIREWVNRIKEKIFN
jgi:hypothetical protein